MQALCECCWSLAPPRTWRHTMGRRRCIWLPPRATWMLLSAAICSYLLLSAAICCYLLLSAAICCHLLLSAAICCCLLHVCCYLLLSAAICCYLLSSAAICCYLLLSAAICYSCVALGNLLAALLCAARSCLQVASRQCASRHGFAEKRAVSP